MLERGIDARHASSCKRPISSYLQAEPGMPRVIDLQFGTMVFVSRGCTTIPDHIKRSIRTLPSHEPSNLERKARLSQSQRSVACITGISGQLEAGSVNREPSVIRLDATNRVSNQSAEGLRWNGRALDSGGSCGNKCCVTSHDPPESNALLHHIHSNCVFT